MFNDFKKAYALLRAGTPSRQELEAMLTPTKDRNVGKVARYVVQHNRGNKYGVIRACIGSFGLARELKRQRIGIALTSGYMKRK